MDEVTMDVDGLVLEDFDRDYQREAEKYKNEILKKHNERLELERQAEKLKEAKPMRDVSDGSRKI